MTLLELYFPTFAAAEKAEKAANEMSNFYYNNNNCLNKNSMLCMSGNCNNCFGKLTIADAKRKADHTGRIPKFSIGVSDEANERFEQLTMGTSYSIARDKYDGMDINQKKRYDNLAKYANIKLI